MKSTKNKGVRIYFVCVNNVRSKMVPKGSSLIYSFPVELIQNIVEKSNHEKYPINGT